MEKPRLIREIEGEIARATHRRYVINLELLDVTSLREFERLLRDLTTEKNHAVRRGSHHSGKDKS
jgi:hypothetical protein